MSSVCVHVDGMVIEYGDVVAAYGVCCLDCLFVVMLLWCSCLCMRVVYAELLVSLDVIGTVAGGLIGGVLFVCVRTVLSCNDWSWFMTRIDAYRCMPSFLCLMLVSGCGGLC